MYTLFFAKKPSPEKQYKNTTKIIEYCKKEQEHKIKKKKKKIMKLEHNTHTMLINQEI